MDSSSSRTARPALASTSASRSSPRARGPQTLPIFSSRLYRSAPSFKGRKQEVGRALAARWGAFLPWLALIVVWFVLGYRLHISWSEGQLRAPSDTPKLRLKGWWSLAADSHESGDPEVDLREENSALPLSDDDLEAISEHATDRVVGPFEYPPPGSKAQACANQGRFPEFVRRKSFVVVFHELSMTGAPLAMLELASKIVRCGGKVSAVILNKRGGLYKELVERGITIVRDKYSHSYKAAAGADLVVASSATCNLWIDQYLRHNSKGGERLIWWVMENRREYFERAKALLGKPHTLVFLSETQEQLWRQWAREDAVALASSIKVVSLSISDALAAAAGLDDDEGERKRQMLRSRVRSEMGVAPSDYLVASLSSINPGKGQLLMLQAALMVTQGDMNLTQHIFDETGLRERKGTGRNLKVLLGSVGSKSNKEEYLERIHELITLHPRLTEMLLWTEATVHVAPLYAAADAYIINAQGIGETFGRVTVEAMAFGLPVLGTDAGGTKEIVQANVTGLLHPAGQAGVAVLAQNLRWLLSHPEVGLDMGKRGRMRVQEMYREDPMYEAMANVFIDCVQERGG